MNPWLQRRIFSCHLCGAKYLHDKAREHQLYRCPRRAAIVQGEGGRPVPRTVPEAARASSYSGTAAPILLNGR